MQTFRGLKHERKTSPSLRGSRKQPPPWASSSAFTVCWLPFFLLSTARPLHLRHRPAAASRCGWRGHVCGWVMQTLINPFIYAFFNRDLRTTYRSLLQCQYRNINRKLSAAGMHEALKPREAGEARAVP